MGGWHASKTSQEWLYKPTSGIYYHTPPETLWKKTPPKSENRSVESKFVQVDSASGRGLGGLAAARTCGAPLGTSIRKACFTAWRAEVRKFTKFEEMDFDLSAGCDEGRMQIPPHASAPCREQSSEGNNYVHPVAEANGGTLSSLLSFFPWMASSLQPATAMEDERAQPVDEPSVCRLTVSAVLRHNMMKRATELDPGSPRPYERWAKWESVAPVHREREGAWRKHMRARTAPPVI